MGTVHRAQRRPQADHRVLRQAAQVLLIVGAFAVAFATDAEDFLEDIHPAAPDEQHACGGRCSAMHPDGTRSLVASSQANPEAAARRRERALRAETGHPKIGDPDAELFEYNRDTGAYTNLSNTPGYDGEGAYSPDGARIVFTSNRHAYSGGLSGANAGNAGVDASFQMDLYLMDSGGRQVRRLTDAPGADREAAFSADGQKICWSHYAEEGASAEIWVMNANGTHRRAITRLGAVSGAPAFHPTGDYVIFSTRRQGDDKHELYLVDAGGAHKALRVTDAANAYASPRFSHDGASIMWCSDRDLSASMQPFTATWNDAAARAALGLESAAAKAATEPRVAAMLDARATAPEIRAADLCKHIKNLASEEMNGRQAGTEGERLATEYVAKFFEGLGLVPAGDNGTWYQRFEFKAGVTLGPGNRLAATKSGESHSFAADEEWRPLAFSGMGKIPAGELVFAGYGIAAPASGDNEGQDSYQGLDVAGKWVLVYRGLPGGLPPEQGAYLTPYASPLEKTKAARDRGAHGILFLRPFEGDDEEEMISLDFAGSLGSKRIGAISLGDTAAAALLSSLGTNPKALWRASKSASAIQDADLSGLRVEAEVWLDIRKAIGRNVLARLPMAGSDPAAPVVLVGAHVDHLGRLNKGIPGTDSSSGAAAGRVYAGADDNASGVAAMMELAEFAAASGSLRLNARDLLFAAWSGEEVRTDPLAGSTHFVDALAAALGNQQSIRDAIAACLNMDMVGRLMQKLTVTGIGTSSVWRRLVPDCNTSIGLQLELSEEWKLPTDSTPFYQRQVPFAGAFTGIHRQYHTTYDTPEKINYAGTEKIARLMAEIALRLVRNPVPPDYQPPPGAKDSPQPPIPGSAAPAKIKQ